MAFDYKKEYKEFYLPPKQPGIVEMPKMNFLAVRGKGDPNEENGEYKRAMELLYGMAYTIKMSYKGEHIIEGFFEYVVPPLEGLWWMREEDGVDFTRKDGFYWISMIRQPEFVTEAVFEEAKQKLLKKKPELNFDRTRLVRWTEGLCCQVMHTGPYDDEPATLSRLEQFIAENGCVPDYTESRKHHEIYLGDPRRTAPERLRTVLRLPVKKVCK